MPARELLRLLRTRPFVPFRIHMADGTTHYDVRHPELVLPGLRSAIVAFPDPDNEGLFRSWEIVALAHVARLELIEAAAQAG
jgi:hypothetical protein